MEESLTNICKDISISILKWFESNREGVEELIIAKEEGCRYFRIPNVVINQYNRNATFEVRLIQDFEPDDNRLIMNISIDFEDKLYLESEGPEFTSQALKVINSYNAKNKSKRFIYDEKSDQITLCQTLYLYPGNKMSDDDISNILNAFFDKDVDDIIELIESGGWLFPELYLALNN